jgi:hypothetical protein
VRSWSAPPPPSTQTRSVTHVAVTKSGSTLTYSAAAGRTNVPNFTVSGTTVHVDRDTGDDDPLQSTTCDATGGGEYDCAQIARIVIDARDGDDIVTATSVTLPVSVDGGAGADQLRTGSGADTLIGGDGEDFLDAGAGNDTLDGGAGDDQLSGGTGADRLIGGTGIDTGFYVATAAAPAPSVSLDGVANDGVPGEGDDFALDIEDVDLGGLLGVVPSASSLSGSAAANVLTTAGGNDTVSGGLGNDTIDSGAGDDAIDARDGFADRVTCGPGTDVVSADTLDVVSASCEAVNVTDVGNALDDRPPTVAWTAPASGAKLGAAATLSANASDDRGVALVRFLDDDRVICEDSAAPFTCAYEPRGDDVGRDTLTVVAVDSSGQTASAQRVVSVNRFKIAVVLSVRPRGATYTAGGRVERPANVTRAQACKGTVTVKMKARGKTLATKKGKLTSRCTFSVRGFRSKASKLRFSASFAGNDYLLPRSRTVSPTKR